MTKLEAIQAMEQGKKVQHRWFSKDEWMTIENGKIVFEDGARCTINEFFSFRNIEGWNDGYNLFNSEQEAKVSDTTKVQ
jgi:hypothetical protein